MHVSVVTMLCASFFQIKDGTLLDSITEGVSNLSTKVTMSHNLVLAASRLLALCSVDLAFNFAHFAL